MTLTWNTRYLANDTPWDRGTVSPFLWHHLDRLPANLQVLVPGCGTGHEVVALAAVGHQVTALDLAPEALRRCQERLENKDLRAELLQGDVLTWQPQRTFDLVYEQTCLCALDPSERDVYAQRLLEWVSPEGLLLAAFFQTHTEDGPPYHCGLDEMRQLFPPSLWRWPEHPPLRIDHPLGPYELGVALKRTTA